MNSSSWARNVKPGDLVMPVNTYSVSTVPANAFVDALVGNLIMGEVYIIVAVLNDRSRSTYVIGPQCGWTGGYAWMPAE